MRAMFHWRVTEAEHDLAMQTAAIKLTKLNKTFTWGDREHVNTAVGYAGECVAGHWQGWTPPWDCSGETDHGEDYRHNGLIVGVRTNQTSYGELICHVRDLDKPLIPDVWLLVVQMTRLDFVLVGGTTKHPTEWDKIRSNLPSGRNWVLDQSRLEPLSVINAILEQGVRSDALREWRP